MIRWFFSKTVRQATAMRRHVWKLMQAQRDLLPAEGVDAITAAIATLRDKTGQGTNKGAIRLAMEELEFTANRWLKPYPYAAWRENVEVVLVALTVAMGIRTFVLQPFKIPTGSMQPTLYGVTSENLIGQPDFKVPTGIERVRQWFAGLSYVHVVAKRDGVIEEFEPPRRLLILNLWQRVKVGGEWQWLIFPPDFGGETLQSRADLRPGTRYKAGQDIAKLKVICGDHLFVNRITYNFRRPERGEIVVFKTAGTQIQQQDQFYIKRMVGMGEERVQIGNDRHLVINGVRLDRGSDWPHFAMVYSFPTNLPPRPDKYSGHVNNTVAATLGMRGLAPLFDDPQSVYTVPPHHYIVMGDNTLRSSDSRFWGPFSEKNIIGKSSFVYWPISSRFGFGYR